MDSPARTELLLIGGRSGVGKSTVAAEIHRQLSLHEVGHAWIEGDNLDMAFPVPWLAGHELAEANLSAMWANYRRIGHTRLIYVNTASLYDHVVASLVSAMGDDPLVHGVLLTSSHEVADARLAEREIGGGLTGAAERGRRAAGELDRQVGSQMWRLHTDGQSPAELASAIIDFSGWHAPSTAEPMPTDTDD